MEHPITILERYWQFTSFRPMQESIIESVLNNEDTLALLPTGGGKSICFQIPALAKDGICIVISPLVALMKDQVNSLMQKGIKAMALTSGLKYNELDNMLDNCIYGNYKFLYLSPERLQQDIVQARIKRMNVNLIAVDEAHCISQWGSDFRPAYKNIKLLRDLHPSVNIVALTATAKPEVIEEILSDLDTLNPKVFRGSFARPNISYIVMHAEDKHYKIDQILKRYSGPSIIYVRSRKASVEISDFLISKGYESTFYHGGITNKEKQDRLYQWTHNQKPIMVATTAFGMGIDKADVQTIIHVNLPESLESYYQEAGRAGRNNEEAYAIILKDNSDENRLKSQFLSALPDVSYIKMIYRKLCNYFQISYGEGQDLSFQFNFNDFCKTYNLQSLVTFNALQRLDRTSVISLSQQFNYQTKVQFLIESQALNTYVQTRQHLSLLIKALLRTYGGIFEHLLKINIILLADKTRLDETEVISQLRQLEADGIIEFKHSNTDSELTFIAPREDDSTINRISKTITQLNTLKTNQIESVIKYINNDTKCKSLQLQHYFGEDTKTECGKCSVCRSNEKTSKASSVDIKSQIINLLKEQPLNSRLILEQVNCSEDQLIEILKEMMGLQQIKLTASNAFTLTK
ncbi:MAG: recombinase RecQ [Bacteroidetes bacterium MedPE-SWsnd-G2]|nr:MAG: recombinase RecQ [Bacteroidetes bacterium MedPE-SWsnd-G2]